MDEVLSQMPTKDKLARAAPAAARRGPVFPDLAGMPLSASRERPPAAVPAATASTENRPAAHPMIPRVLAGPRVNHGSVPETRKPRVKSTF